MPRDVMLTGTGTGAAPLAPWTPVRVESVPGMSPTVALDTAFVPPRQLHRLALEVLETPLAVTERRLAAVLHVLGPRIGIGPQPDVAALGMPGRRADRAFRVADGVAVIPIMGEVVKRGYAVDAGSGLVGVEELTATFRQALAAPDVEAILLHIDSDGGTVEGTADFADLVHRSRGTKPIWAIADESAHSAAYWIASAADRVILPQHGSLGSIGVIAVHVDRSQALESAGYRVTTVTAGAHKADFSPNAPLTTDAAKRLQAEVDRIYDGFVAAVAKHRGLGAKAVRATEALTYSGAAAVAAGLADGIATFDDTFLELATQPRRRPSSTTSKGRTAAMADDTVIQLDEHRKQVDAARVVARAAERERLSAITNMCTAAGLTARIAEFAQSDLTLEAISAQLVAAKAAADATEINARQPARTAAAPDDASTIYARRRGWTQQLARECRSAEGAVRA